MAEKLYPCDPSKNKECNKRGCYQNGGPCRSTTHAEYCDAGDLISKEALMQTLQNEHCCGCDLHECCDEDDCYMGEIFQAVRSAPTIEAEPIKHGQWIDRTEDEDGIYEFCSVCQVDVDITHYGKSFAYCPNCGAKMDEVEE